MLMDSEKIKQEIDNRMCFLKSSTNQSFQNGYELALKQMKDWISAQEELFEVFKNAGRN